MGSFKKPFQKFAQIKQRWKKKKSYIEIMNDFKKAPWIVKLYKICSAFTFIRVLLNATILFLELLYFLLPYLIKLLELIDSLALILSYVKGLFIMDFSSCPIYKTSTKRYLSKLLEVEVSFLRNVDKYVEPYSFVKEVNGKIRKLYTTTSLHKRILDNIHKHLNLINVPSYLFGGIKGTSYVSNGKKHLNMSKMMYIDISNFFPSTNDSYVYSFFRHSLELPTDIAKILTNLTTVQEGNKRFLPQGFSTSPLLSFFSYKEMYEELNSFAKDNNYIFTAYYDDLTFSSNKFIHKSNFNKVKSIIERRGLKVNKRKSKITNINYNEITGVIINKDQVKAPKKQFKNAHDCYQLLLKMDKDASLDDFRYFLPVINKFQGYISLLKTIEPDREFIHYRNTINYIKNKYKF